MQKIADSTYRAARFDAWRTSLVDYSPARLSCRRLTPPAEAETKLESRATQNSRNSNNREKARNDAKAAAASLSTLVICARFYQSAHTGAGSVARVGRRRPDNTSSYH